MLRHFKESEFDCRATGAKTKCAPWFMSLVDDAREIAGIPFIISAYRSPEHPLEKERDTPSAHQAAVAIDVACANARDRYRIVNALLTVGFTRIGVYDKHVHGDVSESRDQKVLWIGESK